MKQETVQILWNEPVAPSVYRIGMTCGSDYEGSVPGQFVTLRMPEASGPLLRRPFSIHRLISTGTRQRGIEILYKAVGGFTRKLSHLPTGADIDLLGPLGSGFSISPAIRSAVLVAGGMGAAPMMFLAEKLILAGIRLEETCVCLGGRTGDDILCESQFQSMGIETRLTTEDGRIGQKGLVTEALSGWLKSHQPEIIYACGPMPMLGAVSSIARQYELPCEVSIETIMACGVGACLGCAIKDTRHAEGYGHVCIDGPVFDATRLNLTAK